MTTIKVLSGALLAVAAVYIAWAGSAGRPLPFGLSTGAALWTAVGLGLVACSIGGIGEGLARAGGDWLNVWILAGIVIGVALLAAIGAAATGIQVGPLGVSTSWLLVVAVLIAAKFAVTSAHALTALVAKG